MIDLLSTMNQPIQEMEVDENDKFGKKYSTTEPPTKLVMKPDL